MLAWPHRDESKAEQLEGLADALEAGLEADALFGAEAGRGGIAPVLAGRGLTSEPVVQEIFSAAESAGRLPAAMRTQAAALRQRAALLRELAAALRYPILLFGVACLAGYVSQIVSGGSKLAGLVIPVAILAAIVGTAFLLPVWSRRGPIPGLAPLLRERGELRYLEVLHGLYASGVPILAAHERATSIVTPDWVRIPYARASLLLSERTIGIGEALTAATAVTPETSRTLLSAEKAGELEAALARLIMYRRASHGRRLARAFRLTAYAIGGIATLYALWTIFSFYSGYFSNLGALRRR